MNYDVSVPSALGDKPSLHCATLGSAQCANGCVNQPHVIPSEAS
jgi:hypothetical protein